MVRIGNRIRLNAAELDSYRLFAGIHADVPETVEEFNARLERQARFLEEEAGPDGRMAALLARELLIH